MIIPLLEKGTKYDKNAVKELVNRGWDEGVATKLIKELFTDKKLHAFNHCPSWFEKYIVPVARIFDEEVKGDKNDIEGFQKKIDEFAEEALPILDQYLVWAKTTRDTDPEKYGSKLDEQFKKMSYSDVVKAVEEIQNSMGAGDEDYGDVNTAKFTLVPIEDYKEMHRRYGGRKTGDGKSDAYAGGGGTAWCHTNNEGIFNGSSYFNNGKNKCFVLQNNDWENIKFNPKTNAENPRDEYGNSLIALFTNRFGKLLKCTLRCNHVGQRHNVPEDRDGDWMYTNYADLSKIAGFNVEKEILKYCDDPNDISEKNIYLISEENVLNGIDEEMYELNPIPTLTIPSNVKVIGYGALSKFCIQNNVNKIILPEGLTTIRDRAFSGLNITEIKIPSTVSTISQGAFFDCHSLQSIDLSSTQIKTVEESLFHECYELNEVKLPETVETIRMGAFYMCRQLKNINAPTNLTVVGNSAFYECTALKSFDLKNVTKIGSGSFKLCSALTSIDLSSAQSVGSEAFYGCEGIKELTIDHEIDFGSGAFNKSGIEVINHPENIEIEDYIFVGTPYGKTIVYKVKPYDDDGGILNSVPATVTSFAGTIEVEDGTTMIGEQVFGHDNILQKITIPSSVFTIGSQAFYNCGNLEEVVLSEGLLEISSGAFQLCKNLKKITIPNSVIRIGREAFDGCEKLEEINIPDGLKVIRAGTFKNCKSLASIVIPESVKKIKEEAFMNCTSLEDVTVSRYTTVSSGAFGYTPWIEDNAGYFTESYMRGKLALEEDYEEDKLSL